MCGICGIYSLGKDGIEENLKKMQATLVHRGPDDEGIYLSGSQVHSSGYKIGLGHRRLSIIDLERGNQPIHNEDKTIWIVFNGEIYNFLELRDELEKKGHRFYTNSDTEVIVHLYEDLGKHCVHKLNGMFAFAIWDEKKTRLLLVRDQIGIKPLLYIPDSSSFVFASELKAILASGLFKPTLNYEALHRFLLFSYIPSPQTIFSEVKKLPAGHLLIVKDGQITIERYWKIEPKEIRRHEEEYAEQIYELLKDSIRLRLISDVPLGAFLSGGIDSTSTVGMMSKLVDQPIKTFSIGFKDESFNELRFARIAANFFKTDHHELVLEPDSVKLVVKLIDFLDEPFADVSAIPTYLVSQLARSEVTVVLCGDGGDELFAGYDNYLASRIDRYYRFIPFSIRKNIAQAAKKISPTSKSKGFINKFKRFLEGSSLPEEGGHIRWMTFFYPEEIERLYTNELKDKIRKLSFFEPYKNFFKKTPASLNEELLCDLSIWLPDDILFKVDMMSMAHSLEARVPFLDHRFVELAFTIPSNLKLKGFNRKYIFKKAMLKILPAEIINRQEKMGFIIPIKNWLRQDLREIMCDLLSKESIERDGLFNYDYIQRLIKEHSDGQQDHWHRLWALMIFMMWKKRWM